MNIRPLVLILALIGTAHADLDLIGKWNAEAGLPNGGTNEAVLTFEKGEDGIKGISTSEDGNRQFRKVNVEGTKLTIEFGIDYNGTPVTVRIKAEEKSPGHLSGRWVALTEDGTQHVDEDWKATKEKTKAEKNWLVGEWDSVATVNDRELKSVITIVAKEEGYSGKITSERGDQALEKVSTDGTSATIDFTMERDGNAIDIRITANAETPTVLKGKWVIFDAAGEEAMTGPWQANKRVSGLSPESLTGEWDLLAKIAGRESDYTLTLTPSGNGLTGSLTSPRSGEHALDSVSISDDKVSLKITREARAMLYEGTLKDGILSGTLVPAGLEAFSGTWQATRKAEQK